MQNLRGSYDPDQEIIMLPHSNEAEDALIGCLLLDPTCIFEVQRICSPDDLYSVKHKWIYEAIMAVHEARRPIDDLTLCEELRNQGRLTDIGGQSELTRLTITVPTAINAAEYAHIVADYALRRRFIDVGSDIVRMAHDIDGDVATMLAKIGADFSEAMPKTEDGAHLTGDAALVGYLGTLGERADRLAKDPNSLLSTGWTEIDRWFPFEPGSLIMVCGAPGIGKTMLMENIAENNARHEKHVVFYHFELSHDVMLDRRMARHSGVDYYRLRRGEMPEPVHAATQRLSKWQHNMVYVHCPGWTMTQVAADIARLDFEWGVDLVVVDYLQKAALPMLRGRNEASLIGMVAEQLKNVAETAAIPIIMGSQVNRAMYSRSDQKPHLGDIRSSGEPAEKANVVVLIHRNKDEDKQQPEDRTEVYLEKNTFGYCGHAVLLHRPGLYRFDEVEWRNISTDEAVNGTDWYKD